MKNVIKNAVFFKLFWYEGFVHWKLKLLRFLVDSVLMFSGLLQKDQFKGKWSLAKSYFKQNYCHACHTRFAVFLPLPTATVGKTSLKKWIRGFSIFITVIPSRLLCHMYPTSLRVVFLNKSLIQVKKEKENVVVACLRWCYTRRFATTIFSVTQGLNVGTTLQLWSLSDLMTLDPR